MLSMQLSRQLTGLHSSTSHVLSSALTAPLSLCTASALRCVAGRDRHCRLSIAAAGAAPAGQLLAAAV
jgi:hypothetical protein